PKVVVMPRICNSGLRKASARAKASSMSSPMSVSRITFSGRAGGGEDWAEQSGTAGRIAQTRMEMRTAMNLDRCKRLNSVRHGADGNEQIIKRNVGAVERT